MCFTYIQWYWKWYKSSGYWAQISGLLLFPLWVVVSTCLLPQPVPFGHWKSLLSTREGSESLLTVHREWVTITNPLLQVLVVVFCGGGDCQEDIVKVKVSSPIHLLVGWNCWVCTTRAYTHTSYLCFGCVIAGRFPQGWKSLLSHQRVHISWTYGGWHCIQVVNIKNCGGNMLVCNIILLILQVFTGSSSLKHNIDR